MVCCRSGAIIIDRGADWLGRVDRHPALGILITHAHPDHMDGLRWGSAAPVYATAETWRRMRRWPVADRRILLMRHPISVGGLQVEAWPVDHATNAPTVGFRVSARGVAIFYAPDVARLKNPSRVLGGVDLYVGDGACVARPLIRRRGLALIGHATIATQLEWCDVAGVRHAIFTHCGSAIVRSDRRRIEAQIRAMGRSHDCVARIAHDGMVAQVRSVQQGSRRDHSISKKFALTAEILAGAKR
jgi:phosphoribosyl 1,2-cyclic phosphodiesterase